VQVVGSSYHSSYRAVLWQGGTVTDLNGQLPKKSGWSLLENAYGINDAGQIVGEGQGPSGSEHAFLLTPTSKKTAMALASISPPIANHKSAGWLRLTPSTAGQALMAAAIPSLGNMAIIPADLGGHPLGLADETIHGANGQAAFTDAADTSGWVRYVDQTPRNDSRMANTREQLIRQTFETNDA
jgi:probable HAF family extracellular repeat protein